MALDQIEADLWRRAMAGERPDPAALYQDPGVADPSAGLPPGATAQVGAGGTTGMGASGVGNEPQQMGGAGGTIGESGGGYEGAPGIVDPAAGGAREQQIAAAPAAPAMAQVAAGPAPAMPAQGAGKPVPAGTGPSAGVPKWLSDYANQEGLAPPEPERDPHLPAIPETPGEQRVRRELQGEAFAGVENQYEAEKYAREAQLRSAQAAMEAQQKVDLENQQKAAERAKRMQERENKFREMADHVAAEPIDSKRLWNNMGTGEKIMQRLAIFLGALGTAAGGPNVAMQKIEADIDRDMEAQKQNKAGQYQRLNDEKTLYDMASERFEDEASQDAAARESAYRKIAQQLDFFGQHVQEPARREAVEGLKREVEARILDAEQQRRRANEIHVMQLEAAQAQARAAMLAARKPKLDKSVKTDLSKREAELRASVENLKDVYAQIQKTNPGSSERKRLIERAASAAAGVEGMKQRTSDEISVTRELVGVGRGDVFDTDRLKNYINEAERQHKRLQGQLEGAPTPEGVK
jgi:hypothetical protein